MNRLENVLYFLVILLLPTQLGKHFWPGFTKVFSLPIDYLSPTIYLWDILVICLLATALVARRSINRLALNIFLAFILLQLTSLIPHIFIDPFAIGRGLVRVEQYLISGLFGVYVASLEFRRSLKLLFLPLSISLIAESALAITQFLMGRNLGLWIVGE